METTIQQQTTPQQNFLKAVEVLKKFGWRQKNFGNEKIGFCALGALGQAKGIVINDGAQCRLWPEYQLFLNAANRSNYGSHVYRHISSWNDANDRTKEEVIKAFEAAAAEVAAATPSST